MHGRPLWETSHLTFRARHERHAFGALLRTLPAGLVFGSTGCGGSDAEDMVGVGDMSTGTGDKVQHSTQHTHDKQQGGNRKETDDCFARSGTRSDKTSQKAIGENRGVCGVWLRLLRTPSRNCLPNLGSLNMGTIRGLEIAAAWLHCGLPSLRGCSTRRPSV
jgi:hypothetical protein